MPIVPPASFCDLDKAREVAERLVVAHRQTSAKDSFNVAMASPALSLSVATSPAAGIPTASRVERPRPSPPQTSPAALSTAAPGIKKSRYGPGAWEAVLRLAVQMTHCLGGVVMDEQGLLIASMGQWPEDRMENVGSRIMIMLEHARSIGDDIQCVAAETSHAWITGLPLRFGKNILTVVLWSREPLPANQRRSLLEMVTRPKA